MIAPRPLDQTRRLATIRAFDLGTKVHEGKLDPLVELAAQITTCPVSLVSIVHADCQIFEASCGVDIAGTDLGSSICSHAILEDGILEIPDCRLDMRTRDNPLVTDPDRPLLFYAGAPIVTKDGVTLGTFCVLDERPRRLGDHQRRALSILAGQAMQILELHRAVQRADELRREADHRVKNSLAGIAAIARMSARAAESDETRGALQQIQTRIETTANLHAELYRQDMGEQAIEVSGYLSGLLSHLRGLAPLGVSVVADFAPLQLQSNKAGAIGLLVNEMVSNAFKHGFAEGGPGEVGLKGTLGAPGEYVIACVDNGSAEGPVADGSGLGTQLMASAASQLNATLEAGPRAGGGFSVRLTIPLSDP